MKKIAATACAVLLAAGLVGCANQGGGITNQQAGTVVGGVAGGILGSAVFHGDSQIFGAVGGAILGSLIGGAVGQSMDQQDALNAQQAMITTPIGKEATWTNPKTHAAYTVRPIREYKVHGAYCRRARIYTYFEGQRHIAYAKVCRHNGKWVLQK